MDYLAKNLRDWMKARGIKEEAAGEAIGIAQSTVNRIVNPGSSRKIGNPTHRTLQKIATALGSNTHDIIHKDLTDSGALDSSHPAGLDHRKLAIALDAVDKAVRAMNMDPSGSWGDVAKLVLWAIALQDELYPDGVNGEADQRGFEAQVRLEMATGGYDGFGATERNAAGGDDGSQQAAPAGKTHRSRGSRWHP